MTRQALVHEQCRLSLRERTPFRGAKGDKTTGGSLSCVVTLPIGRKRGSGCPALLSVQGKCQVGEQKAVEIVGGESVVAG